MEEVKVQCFQWIGFCPKCESLVWVGNNESPYDCDCGARLKLEYTD